MRARGRLLSHCTCCPSPGWVAHHANARSRPAPCHIPREQAVRVVGAHDFGAQPLFLYLAYQGVHAPAEVPTSYVDAYSTTIAEPKRRTFAGMLSCVDEGIANVTAALKAAGAGVYANTLVRPLLWGKR